MLVAGENESEPEVGCFALNEKGNGGRRRVETDASGVAEDVDALIAGGALDPVDSAGNFIVVEPEPVACGAIFCSPAAGPGVDTTLLADGDPGADSAVRGELIVDTGRGGRLARFGAMRIEPESLRCAEGCRVDETVGGGGSGSGGSDPCRGRMST